MQLNSSQCPAAAPRDRPVVQNLTTFFGFLACLSSANTTGRCPFGAGATFSFFFFVGAGSAGSSVCMRRRTVHISSVQDIRTIYKQGLLHAAT